MNPKSICISGKETSTIARNHLCHLEESILALFRLCRATDIVSSKEYEAMLAYLAKLIAGIANSIEACDKAIVHNFSDKENFNDA